MEHIRLALSVLRDKTYDLKDELDNESLSPEEKDEVMQELQRLNRAIMDIQKHFLS